MTISLRFFRGIENDHEQSHDEELLEANKEGGSQGIALPRTSAYIFDQYRQRHQASCAYCEELAQKIIPIKKRGLRKIPKPQFKTASPLVYRRRRS
jgi:hypothetical protein